MKLVLDASAAMNVALGKAPESLLTKLENADLVTAPELFFTEVSNAIWKYHRFEKLPLEDCLKMKRRCFELVDKTMPTAELIEEAFLIACEAQHSVYDACYLVCAKRHHAALITMDQKLVKVADHFSISTSYYQHKKHDNSGS